MTGEITLRGRVLPIGGVKEKVLAAHRAGIDTIIIPVENKKDLEEIPENVRKTIKLFWQTIWKRAQYCIGGYLLKQIVDLPVEDDIKAADINKDGKVNSTDMSILKRVILRNYPL